MFGGSDGEAQVRAVVEGVEPWFEAFGRGETADEMRVAGFEFRERPFGLAKRGFEEGVAVAGEHYVVAEGDHDGEHGGGAGRNMDGDRLCGRRSVELHHHHRHSVRHSIVQDGQISAMAVRLANPQLVNHFRSLRPA